MTEWDHEPEGATPLEPDEKEGLTHPHVTTRAQLNELEQANIEQALVWLPSRRRFDILSEASLRRLHERLFGDVWRWAGTFRQTEKNIGIDPLQIGVALRALLEDARYWAENGTHEPLEAAARFHHRLVQIHLFPNGNGRHARIAADLYLEEYFDGHPPIDWEAGHDLLGDGSRRAAYITALKAADGHDHAPLLAFVNATGATR